MTDQVIERLRNVIRRHNRAYGPEMRMTFQVVNDHVHLSPAMGDTIYYGELLAYFCSEYDLEMFIFGTSDQSVIVSLV